MPKSLIAAVGGVVFVFAATSASAANPEFCRDYAHTALNQVHAAMSHPRCDWRTDRNPSRWSTDFRHHFEWCRGASRDEADAERLARRNALDHCAR